ncbi:hypothetical protein ACFE04_008687 [Oxalis oulophora]
MASAKKQEHLEAGKRRLEEFRKKKAAERSKKTASTNLPNTSADNSLQEKQRVEDEVRHTSHSNAARNSSEPDGDVNHPTGSIISNNITADDSTETSEPITLNNVHSNDHSLKNEYTTFSKPPVQRHLTDKKFNASGYSASFVPENFSSSQQIKGRSNYFGLYGGELASETYDNNFSQSIIHETDGSHLKENNGPLTALTVSSSSPFHDSATKVSSSTVLQSHTSNANTLDNGHAFSSKGFTGSSISDLVEQKLSSSGSNIAFKQTSPSLGLNFDSGSFSSQTSLYSATNESTRRSRPSFLDSINLPKAEPEIVNDSQNNNTNDLGSSAFPKLSTETESSGTFSKFTTRSFDNFGKSSVFASDGGNLLKSSTNNNSLETKNDFYMAKQNEEFAALEQHIEDLTQEKFSLQRALDASQTLAESLTAENSSLTDSYNQQRSVVNQLRSDMQTLQDEIMAQLAELEAFKHEYANARLECNAADERANILASEIWIDSKVQKKMYSLEKDRQDLRSTVSALQEEYQDTNPDTSNLEGSSLRSDESNSRLVSDSGDLEVSSLNIPSDQKRIIQNINALISELTLEKQELRQALSSELSQSSKLKELNKELSRKLEAQTQRLELVTAQTMANGNVSVRQPDQDAVILPENTPFADEGDEVVERVLGWIMKLFPGGPTKRRSSKLL